MTPPDIAKTIKQVDDYLTALRLSGNYNARQRIGLSNQALPAFFDAARNAVLSAVAKGALAEAFLQAWEDEHPTHGRPLPEVFAIYVKAAASPKNPDAPEGARVADTA